MTALLASLFLVLNFLHRNSYPVYKPEAVLLWLIVLAPLTMLWAICKITKRPWFFTAFCAFLIMDLAVGWHRLLPFLPKYAAVAAGLTLLLFAATAMRAQAQKIFFQSLVLALIAGTVMNGFQAVQLYSRKLPSEPSKASRDSSVFFFILDEHAGLAGFPRELEDSNRLEVEIADRYTRNGFIVYANAYSNFNATLDSIPSLVNAEIAPRLELLSGKVLKKNLLFEKWKLNLPIFVYQNTHLGYGTKGMGSYKSFTYQESSAGYIEKLPFGPTEKLRVLVNNFIESHESLAAKKIFRAFKGRKESRGLYTVGALATPAILDEIKRDVVNQAGRPAVYFAHFLSPHSQYVYDENGNVLPPSEWEPCHAEEIDGKGSLNTPEGRLRKYRKYMGQVRCLHDELGRFFNFLKERGLYKSSTIVLVSDHGSRIYRTNPKPEFLERLTGEDYKDAFSAFLAIKDPVADAQAGMPPGRVSLGFFSTSRILSSYFGYGAPNDSLNGIYILPESSKSPLALPLENLKSSIDIQ